MQQIWIELWPTWFQGAWASFLLYQLPGVHSSASRSTLMQTVFLIPCSGAIVNSLLFFFLNDQASISVIFSILPFLFSPVHLCGGLLKQSGSWMGKNKLCNLKMACPYSKQVLIQTAEGEASPPHFWEFFDFRSRVTVLYSSFAEPPHYASVSSTNKLLGIRHLFLTLLPWDVLELYIPHSACFSSETFVGCLLFIPFHHLPHTLPRLSCNTSISWHHAFLTNWNVCQVFTMSHWHIV